MQSAGDEPKRGMSGSHVVVVNVQPRIRINGARSFEREANVGWTNGVIENVRLVRAYLPSGQVRRLGNRRLEGLTVIVDGLVHNIPHFDSIPVQRGMASGPDSERTIELSLIVSSKALDVLCDSSFQCGAGPWGRRGGQPVRD